MNRMMKSWMQLMEKENMRGNDGHDRKEEESEADADVDDDAGGVLSSVGGGGD